MPAKPKPKRMSSKQMKQTKGGAAVPPVPRSGVPMAESPRIPTRQTGKASSPTKSSSPHTFGDCAQILIDLRNAPRLAGTQWRDPNRNSYLTPRIFNNSSIFYIDLGVSHI